MKKFPFLIILLILTLCLTLFQDSAPRRAHVTLPPEFTRAVVPPSQPPGPERPSMAAFDGIDRPSTWAWRPETGTPLLSGADAQILDQHVQFLTQRNPCDGPLQPDHNIFPLTKAARQHYSDGGDEFENDLKLLMILLTRAHQELAANNSRGLEDLRAAAGLAAYYYRRPPQHQLALANQMYLTLGSFILQDMPKEGWTGKTACLLPDQGAIEQALAAVRWDLFHQANELLDHRALIYDLYFRKERFLKLDYWLAKTPWEPEANKRPLVEAYEYSRHWVRAPYGDAGKQPTLKHGLWHYMRTDYVDHLVSEFALDNLQNHVMTCTLVKALGDRILIQENLIAMGRTADAEEVTRLVHTLGLVNPYTGKPYQVDDAGDLVVLPQGAVSVVREVMDYPDLPGISGL